MAGGDVLALCFSMASVQGSLCLEEDLVGWLVCHPWKGLDVLKVGGWRMERKMDIRAKDHMIWRLGACESPLACNWN
jgi:hypothetical protein